MTRRSLIGCTAVGFGISGFALVLYAASWGWRTTTSLISPDETVRVKLLDNGPEMKLDRNFIIRLERLGTS